MAASDVYTLATGPSLSAEPTAWRSLSARALVSSSSTETGGGKLTSMFNVTSTIYDCLIKSIEATRQFDAREGAHDRNERLGGD